MSEQAGISVSETLNRIGEAVEGLTKAASSLATVAQDIVNVKSVPEKPLIPVINAPKTDPKALWVAAHVAAKGKEMGLIGTPAYQQAQDILRANFGEDIVQKALTSGEVPFLPVDVIDEVETALGNMMMGRRLFRTIRTSAKTGKFPLSSVANAYVATEGLATPESEPTLASRDWTICFVVAPLTLTYEAAYDFAVLQSAIMNVLLQAVGEKEDELFMTGTGVGQPLGIYTALNAAGDLLNAAGMGLPALIQIWNELKEPYKADAVWFMGPETLAKIHSQTHASGFYMGTLQDGFKSMLFGRPVYTHVVLSDHIVLVGSASRYVILDKVNAQTGARELYVDATREGYTLMSTRSIFLMVADAMGGIPLYHRPISLQPWRGMMNFLL